MNARRLFTASCLALVTTSMVFSIRGDILDALGSDFHLTNQQVGIVLSPAFWGFTLSIVFGGALVDFLGMRFLLLLSSAGYLAAVSLIVFAPTPSAPVTPYHADPGFLLLYAGMLTLGLSQGLVEGVINPLCATIYAEQKTHKLNVLHAWWPGGLIIGGLLAYTVTKLMGLDRPGVASDAASLGWRLKLGLILLPAMGYALLARGQRFPPTERVAAGVSSGEMFRESVRPMFILFFVLMWMTAATELGPDQWVGSLITALTGMQGILILVYTAGIMFVLRFFAGPLARRLSPLGLLSLCSLFSAAGLFGLSAAATPLGAFGAATLFGIGKTYYWPTMLALTSERFPRGGAVLLAVMGGAGNLSVAFVLPMMGGWYDRHGAAAAFRFVGVLPIVLALVFAGLFLHYRRTGGYRPVALGAGR